MMKYFLHLVLLTWQGVIIIALGLAISFIISVYFHRMLHSFEETTDAQSQESKEETESL